MDPIVTNPQTRKIHKVVFILSALRPRDVGNFIGRSGVKLQKLAAKGSKIDIVVNEGTKQVEAHIVCSAQAVESLKKKMEEAAVELRKKRDAHEIRVSIYLYVSVGSPPTHASQCHKWYPELINTARLEQ